VKNGEKANFFKTKQNFQFPTDYERFGLAKEQINSNSNSSSNSSSDSNPTVSVVAAPMIGRKGRNTKKNYVYQVGHLIFYEVTIPVTKSSFLLFIYFFVIKILFSDDLVVQSICAFFSMIKNL